MLKFNGSQAFLDTFSMWYHVVMHIFQRIIKMMPYEQRLLLYAMTTLSEETWRSTLPI